MTVYIPWSGSIKFKIVKTPILPKLSYISNVIPIKIQAGVFEEIVSDSRIYLEMQLIKNG